MLHLLARRWRCWIPAECPGCGRRVGSQDLCAGCRAQLHPLAGPARCPHCWHPLVDGHCPDCQGRVPVCDRIVAAFDYAGLGSSLVHQYKHQGRLPLADLLAEQLAQAVRARGWLDGQAPDCLSVVPAHAASVRRRGFSPPAELARLLAPRLGLPYRLDLLRRAHESARQAALPRAARLRAQQGVFHADLRAWPRRAASGHRRVAIVDDVMTTGATLDAAARALKAAGADVVEGWALARALQ